jgi:hypothetical protein
VSEPDFYANATLGFRQWHLSLDATEGIAFLEGLLKYGFHPPHHRWDLGRTNRAESLHARFAPRSVPEGHGEVPGIGCSWSGRKGLSGCALQAPGASGRGAVGVEGLVKRAGPRLPKHPRHTDGLHQPPIPPLQTASKESRAAEHTFP